MDEGVKAGVEMEVGGPIGVGGFGGVVTACRGQSVPTSIITVRFSIAA